MPILVENPPGSGEYELPLGFVEDPPGSGEYDYLGIGYTLVETFPGSGEYELVASLGSVCTYGDGFYGDGLYGTCGRRNVRGCGPARARQVPLTVAVPFDPACHDPEPC